MNYKASVCSSLLVSMRNVLTIILLIQTLEDQSQLLFMILEIVNKFLKIQLSIQVLVSSLHNFLFKKTIKACQLLCSFRQNEDLKIIYTALTFLQKVANRFLITPPVNKAVV